MSRLVGPDRRVSVPRWLVDRGCLLHYADRPGSPAISPTPCKTGKTGRIIDSALRFARVFRGKAIYINRLRAGFRRERTGAYFRRSGRPNRAIRGRAGEATKRRFIGIE